MRSAKIPYKLSQAKVMADNWLQNCPQEWDICFWIPYEGLFCVSFGRASLSSFSTRVARRVVRSVYDATLRIPPHSAEAYSPNLIAGEFR